MAFDRIKKGRILVEIKILNKERILNVFWSRGINIYEVKRTDVATLLLEIDYLNYSEVCDIVEKMGGKIEIVKSRGFVFLLGLLKKKMSLAVGAVLFLGVMFYLSTYIWSIEVEVQKNIPPYEVRKQLSSIGIKPGMSKKDIDVKEIEKQLENLSTEILWLRARIEGSTLKVVIEEKINPPESEELQYGNLVATMEGEVKNVYTFSGRAKVKSGQMVKAGDIVIEGIDGNEGVEYILPPQGVVIANTFYEKSMNVQLNGNSLERSGEKDSDIYITIFGKKIYLKKAIKDFVQYDKIDVSGKIFNKVLYYERVEKEVNLSEEDGISMAVTELEKSLMNDLSRDAKVVDKIIDKKSVDENNLLVKVVFVVEQNIVNNVPVDY